MKSIDDLGWAVQLVSLTGGWVPGQQRFIHVPGRLRALIRRSCTTAPHLMHIRTNECRTYDFTE